MSRASTAKAHPPTIAPGRLRRALGTAAIATAVLLAAPAAAHAASFLVDTPADPPVSPNACTPTDDDCSLRGAVDLANNMSGPDTINFDAALGMITLRGEELLIGDTLAINGPTGATQTVSGNDLSRVFSIAASISVTISNLEIRNGKTTGFENGAGIQSLGPLTVTNSTIRANEADASGGGIFSTKLLTVASSTISGNKAGNVGGGISSQGLTLTSSTITDNTAPGGGGGVFNTSNPLMGTDSTIASNSSTGTLFPASNVQVSAAAPTDSRFKNTIVADPDGGGVNCDENAMFGSATITSDGFNLEATRQSPPGAGSCNFNQATDQVVTEARLAPLAENGGPTPTRALLGDSPAIDKGNATGTDQRGMARPSDFPMVTNATGGDGSDIGAFELQAETACSDGLDNDVDGLTDAADADCAVSPPPPPPPPPAPDRDQDGIPDARDNCPDISNPGQSDGDNNGIGNACEDADGDGLSDARDNCRDTANPNQSDADNDGVGDACESPTPVPPATTTTTPATTTTPSRGPVFCNGREATIVGTGSDDTLPGTSGDDVIAGLGGNDDIESLGGDDLICGGGSGDQINGNGGDDEILGGNGGDDLRGGADDDALAGNTGNDELSGNSGDDELRGGAGPRDECAGGSGEDEEEGGCDKQRSLD